MDRSELHFSFYLEMAKIFTDLPTGSKHNYQKTYGIIYYMLGLCE